MAVTKRGKYYRYKFVFNGTPYQVSTGLTNRHAAVRAQNLHRERLARQAAGIPNPEDHVAEELPTLAEYAPVFLAWSASGHRKSTYTLHRVNCDTLVNFPLTDKRILGDLRLHDIRRADVEEFMRERQKQQRVNVVKRTGRVRKLGRLVSNVTVNRAVTTLRLLFHQAQGRWPHLLNPCKDIQLLPEEPVQRIIKPQEFEEYKRLAPHDLRDVAVCMYDRGMRPQDVVSLTCEQCDFNAQEVELWPKAKPQLVARRITSGGKTPESSRHIVMSPAMRELLLERVEKARILGSKYLFPMLKGKRLVADRHKLAGSLAKPHRKVIARITTDRVRLYDARHTFATNAVANDVHLKVIQDTLGHSNPTMTQRYIKRNDVEAQRRAFARVETPTPAAWKPEYAELFMRWLKEQGEATGS